MRSSRACFAASPPGSADTRTGGGFWDLGGTWKWVTGEPFDCETCYTDWYPGEPNNTGGRENFLELGGGLSCPEGFWNDNETPSRSLAQ